MWGYGQGQGNEKRQGWGRVLVESGGWEQGAWFKCGIPRKTSGTGSHARLWRNGEQKVRKTSVCWVLCSRSILLACGGLRKGGVQSTSSSVMPVNGCIPPKAPSALAEHPPSQQSHMVVADPVAIPAFGCVGVYT